MDKTIKLKGTAYVLDYPFYSLCRMQEEHKVNVFDPAVWVPSPVFSTVIIWGGIIHAKPEITLAEVQQGIDHKEFRAVYKKAVNLLNESLPKAEKTDEQPATTT